VALLPIMVGCAGPGRADRAQRTFGGSRDGVATRSAVARQGTTKAPDGAISGAGAPAAEPSETLAEILDRVTSNALALKARLSEFHASREATRAALAEYFGEVTGFAKDQHTETNEMGDDRNVFGLGAKLPIDLNGRIRSNLRVAGSTEHAVMMDVADLRLELWNLAAKLYRGLQRVAGERAALTEQENALEAHIHVAEAGIAAGRIAEVELTRLSSEFHRVRGALASLDGTEAGFRARLAALMVLPKFEATVPAASESPVPVESELRPEDRPDVRAGELRAEAADAGVRSTIASRLPSLNIDAQLLQNNDYNGTDETNWSATVEVAVPFWDGGRRRARVREAKAKRHAAYDNAHRILEDATAEVVAARASWFAAQARYEASTRALDFARQTMAIQADRFKAGRLSATDLVDAQAALAESEAEMTSSLADWWQTDDALRLALGLPPANYQPSQKVP